MKIKKILFLLLTVVIIFDLTIITFAEDGNVTYVGGAEKFIFTTDSDYSPTDIFADFKDVMPGDSLSQHITIKNDAANKVKINLYLRSLGAQENTDAFLSQLSLRVKQDGSSILYEGPADKSGQLTDWVFLGTVYSGGVISLDIILDVPASISNEFKDAVGYIDWEFMVEELPVSPDDPNVPNTDAISNISLWSSLLIISIIVMFVVISNKQSNNSVD